MYNLLSNFPEPYKPSSVQVDILKKLEKSFNNKRKYVILRAPTGSGKSFISRTLAGASNDCTDGFKSLVQSYDAFKTDQYGEFLHEMDCLAEPSHGAFALTITKQLQDQYGGLFNDGKTLKGKVNYKCNIDENYDVESAPCIFSPKLKNSCWESNKCAYYNARNESVISKFSILNYSMFLSLPGHVKRRNFIICDEASELEEELTNRYSLNIDYSKLALAGLKVKKVTTDNYEAIFSWVNNIHGEVTDCMEKLMAKASNNLAKLSMGDHIKLKFFRNLQRSITNVIDLWSTCEFIVDKNAEKISLTPLYINTVTRDIFDYGDKIVLMSATISRPEFFAKTLGIDKDDYDLIDVESTFEAKKSPIYISTKTPLNYENLKKNLPVIAEQIKQICDNHPNEKGIIHTHTSDICSYLQTKLSGKRFIFREDGMNNEKLLDFHMKSTEPTVMVSPSLGYGTDLHGDNGRFQIIVKTPYPPLSNKRIKKKFDLDKSWYVDKAINTLVQMSGRCTRSKQDHSVTYIMDGTAFKLIKDNITALPKHFVERIV